MDLETFGTTFEIVTLTQMQTIVIESIKIALFEAKVMFSNKEEDENEISKRSMGRKSFN